MIYHTHCYSKEAYELCKALSIFWRDLRVMKSAALMDLAVERLSDNEVAFELHEPPSWGPPSAKQLPDQNDLVEMMRASVAGQQRLISSYRQTKVNRSLMDSSFLPKVEELLDVMLGKRTKSKLICVKLDPFKAEAVSMLEKKLHSMLEERRRIQNKIWFPNELCTQALMDSLNKKIDKIDKATGFIRNALMTLREGSEPSPEELRRCFS